MIIENAALLAALASHGMRTAHGPIDHGTDVTFSADRESDQTVVRIDGAQAKTVADGSRSHQHPPTTHAEHMLDHLVLRLTEFFVAGHLRTMRVSIRLHENGYTIIDATAQGPHALHLPREAPDKVRKGTTNGYRPAGRR